MRIGVLVPLTGSSSRTGVECRRAVETAREVALGDDPDSSAVDIEFGDVNNPEEAEAEVERLVGEEGAQLVIGTVVTPHSLPASARTVEMGAVYWENAAAADAYGQRGLDGAYRFSLRASQYGVGMVACVAEEIVGASGGQARQATVGLAYADTEFARSVAAGALAEARARGVTVAFDRPVGDQESAGELAEELGSTGADALLQVNLGKRAADLWRLLCEQGAPIPTTIGNALWGYTRNVEAAGEWVQGTYTAGTPRLGTFSWEHHTTQAREDARTWMASCGDLGPGHALANAVDRDLFFSGTLALLRAVRASGYPQTAKELTTMIEGMDVPLGSTPVGFGLRFGPDGENERAFLAVSRWEGDTTRTVWPARLASDEQRR